MKEKNITKSKKHRVTVTGMPNDQFLWVSRLAGEQGVSMSAIIKSFLSELKKNERR